MIIYLNFKISLFERNMSVFLISVGLLHFTAGFSLIAQIISSFKICILCTCRNCKVKSSDWKNIFLLLPSMPLMVMLRRLFLHSKYLSFTMENHIFYGKETAVPYFYVILILLSKGSI